MLSPELQIKIATWRQKVADNTLTLEEMREAVKLIRGDRLSAAQASAKSRASKGPKKSGDDLLAELDGI